MTLAQLAESPVLGSIAYRAIDPVAFQVGPLAVRWYGLAYVAGFVIAAWLMLVFARRWNVDLSADDVLTVVLFAVIGVVVGGRLGYVLFYGSGYYFEEPARIIALWDGGMSFHGGLAGIIVGGLLAARSVGVRFITLADLAAIGAPVGFGLGRVANFINGELWGRATDVPWGMVVPGLEGARHPSQLYEAILEGLVLFVVMLVLAMRETREPNGKLFGWMLALYAVFRIAVEFVREPDTQLGFVAGDWLTMGMLLSLPLLAAGVWLIVRARKSTAA